MGQVSTSNERGQSQNFGLNIWWEKMSSGFKRTTQADQGFRCPHIDLLDATENSSLHQSPWLDYMAPLADLGPVVQSIVSLMSSLVVKMLTVLVSTISNSQVQMQKLLVSSVCKSKSYSHFSAKILAYLPYLMIKVLTIRYVTNDIVSFEQQGPGCYCLHFTSQSDQDLRCHWQYYWEL